MVRVPKATPDVSWLFSPDAPPELHPQIPDWYAMSPGTPPVSEVEPDTLNGVNDENVVSGKPIVFDGEDQMVNGPISDDSKPRDLEIDEGIYPSPNPFNTATVLGFYTTGGPVYVTIYNILGQPIRRLVQQHLPAGYYRRIWDGKNDLGASVGSGIYIVLLKNKEAIFTKRVALVK
ncbi:MAG: T9SS type A sorting domain-containing protein [Candidatus Latescibacteria bacterium]|nr:T9SS type A sorting domain-containing protein [Candidatus Latescibacterota bacterium]